MALTQYRMFLGSANAGASPSFSVFARSDTGADITPHPTISASPAGNGWFQFGYDWTTAPSGVNAVQWSLTVNGSDFDDVITNPGAPGVTGITTGTPATASIVGYQTAGQIINRSALQLGLISAFNADPYAQAATGDPVFNQLIEALATSGDDVLKAHNWRHLLNECDITTVANQATYALPPDYHEMVDQSGWNRSTRLPMLGPVSPQEWQYIRAIQVGVVLNVIFRPRDGILELGAQIPAAGTQLAFEYVSTYWVQTANSSVRNASQPSASTDVVCFDPSLMVRATKLSWASDRGFDTSRLQEQYDETLEHCIGKNMGARVLSLTGPRSLNPLISGDANMPISGYGV